MLARVIGSTVLLVLSFSLALGCNEKKKEPPPPSDGGGQLGLVNREIGSAEPGSEAETRKAAIVMQQCALECGVHPESDTVTCTQRCVKECMPSTDVAGIAACAKKAATP